MHVTEDMDGNGGSWPFYYTFRGVFPLLMGVYLKLDMTNLTSKDNPISFREYRGMGIG